MDRLIAHTRKLNHDQLEWQTLQEHSCNVAKLCSEICEPFGLGKLGLLTGWLHDMGKASQDVQDHILRKTLQKLNHCSAGMYWLWEHKRKQNFTDLLFQSWGHSFRWTKFYSCHRKLFQSRIDCQYRKNIRTNF